MDDDGEAFGLSLQAVSPLDADRLCAMMHQALLSLVDALEQAPETPCHALDILSDAERRLILSDWNDTKTGYPHDICVHQLVEQQATNRPEAVAFVYEGTELTYAELNHRANKLAHYLIKQGVGPDKLVALCVDCLLYTSPSPRD